MKHLFDRNVREKAQGVVEFALILPILLMIVYGLLEVGRLIFVYSTVVSASREGARYGSATGVSDAGVVPRYQDCDGIRAAADKVDILGAINTANILISYDKGPGTADYTTCPVGSATGGPTSAQINATPLSRIKVQVSASFSPLAALAPLNPITITSTNARTIIGGVQVAP
jgi:Flp pilus assembly protein TadG